MQFQSVEWKPLQNKVLVKLQRSAMKPDVASWAWLNQVLSFLLLLYRKKGSLYPPNSFPTVNRCQGVDLFVPFEMLPDRHQVATHL